ncbi:hypothetical protein BDK51DRAFT_34308 [Blyttiomyces helicus]|uniref:Uncharacterized protein n=1 Tax=Blyttiomyces helicus TaxID=388810 RepID=A0A4V1IRG5_9FUNG|nr:hypothetical protein BDK51DRAFT_34308 [Blyttiomyces helicus]|eukprot:RKO89977.1 hypothetical protein BDK51DRAFT_34308 [Blyttiomyces helicus]
MVGPQDELAHAQSTHIGGNSWGFLGHIPFKLLDLWRKGHQFARKSSRSEEKELCPAKKKIGESARGTGIRHRFSPPGGHSSHREPAPPAGSRRLHFSGINEGSLGGVCASLRLLDLNTTHVKNGSFIGQSVCELLVPGSYEPTVINSITKQEMVHEIDFDLVSPTNLKRKFNTRNEGKSPDQIAHRLLAFTENFPVLTKI